MVVEEADFLARLTLHQMIEPADPVFCRLQEFANAAQLLAAIQAGSLPDLEPDPTRRNRVAERAIGYRLRLDHVDLAATVKAARAVGARYLTPGHADWPVGFDDLGPERPLGVWWLGDWVPNETTPVVAMVGARSCTGYGSYVAGALAAALGQARLPVASGGALGIDAAAHRGALAGGGETIAFLACGIDQTYPRANELLLKAVRDQGAIVSELPPGVHPNRFRFLTRNRLIAALGNATVVVEAPKRSGSLVTARRAADLGRLVLAVPGPITSGLSVGTHELIRDGAQIVESPQQLVADLAGPQAGHQLQLPIQRRAAKQAQENPASSKTAAVDQFESIAPAANSTPAAVAASATTAAASVTAIAPAATGVTITTDSTARTRTTTLTGLGPSEQIVLEALPTARCAGVQIPELSGATGIEPGTVFAGLGRLAALGLAAKNGSGWVLAPGREREARRYE